MTSSTNSALPDTDEEERRRPRVLIWAVLVMLPLLSAVALTSIFQAGAPNGFGGAEGITIDNSGQEPSWWVDLIVITPTTSVNTVPSSPTTMVPSVVDNPDPAISSPPISVSPTPTIQVIAPGDALFGPGSSELLPDSFDALEESLGGVVTTGVLAHASVRCHTDNQGSAEYNNRLSQSRSDTIVEVLVTLGVPRSVVDARGLGISQTYDNNTETGRALNRRCEIELGVQP